MTLLELYKSIKSNVRFLVEQVVERCPLSLSQLSPPSNRLLERDHIITCAKAIVEMVLALMIHWVSTDSNASVVACVV